MSEEEIKSSVRGVCEALFSRNVEKAVSFYADDATLTWGPFTFKGQKEVEMWATEMGQKFEKLSLMETGLTVEGSKATHEFVLGVFTSDGFRGMLPGVGVYEFRDGKIQHVKITLSYGIVIIKREDEKLYFTKHQCERSRGR